VTRPIGARVQILGNSCAGKSALASRLHAATGLPVIELDALNWEPNWVDLSRADPARLDARILEATAGDRWIVAGSYSRFSERLLWPRLDTVIWVDLPRGLLLRRCLVRSWKRQRSRELLWGTNYESFWKQLRVWRRQDSLLWWIWTQDRPKRERMLARMIDPHWAHIDFVRLTSNAEIRALVDAVSRENDAAQKLRRTAIP